MPYFITKQLGLFSSYKLNKKEEEKLNKFLMFLEDSGVGELIHQECYKDHSKGGRPPYNYYNLFAAPVYAFSKHPGTLRKKEESFKSRPDSLNPFSIISIGQNTKVTFSHP